MAGDDAVAWRQLGSDLCLSQADQLLQLENWEQVRQGQHDMLRLQAVAPAGILLSTCC